MSTARGGPPGPAGDVALPAWLIDALWFGAIFVVALCLRMIYALQLRSCPFFGHEVMDQLYHDEWARAFAAGKSYIDGAYFRAPLYPWFLGTIYWLFGSDPLIPRIVQGMLGSLTCGLLYLIGRHVFRRAVGVLAGFTAATYWLFLYFDNELLITVLKTFLYVLLVWRLLATRDRPRPGLWLLNGLILGVSALARPNILLFAPFVVAWIAVLHWQRWRRVLGYAACFVVGCLLPILPVTIRNYVVGEDFVLISTQAGVNFYIGNNPDSDGVSAAIPGIPLEWWPGYLAQIERAEKAEGRKLKPSEVSGYFAREAWQFIRQRPADALHLTLKKLAYFWSRWEIANNKDIYFITSLYTPIARNLPVGFWFVGPLGALGLLLSLRDARRLFPLWGFVIVYMLSIVAFFVTARYRVPAAAVLIVLAWHAVFSIVTALRERRWRTLVFAAIVLGLMAPVVYHIPEGVDDRMAQGYREVGLTLIKQGKLAEGERMLAESVQRWPGQAKAWYSLGVVKLGQRRFGEAEADLRRALEIDPHYPGVRNNLAVALGAQGRMEAAVVQFELLAHEYPADPRIQANLGSTLLRVERVDEGFQHLVRALELAPENAPVFVQAAQLTAVQGDFTTAIRLLRAGVERLPDNVEMLVTLSAMLATRPDADPQDGPEAVRLAERAGVLTGWEEPHAADAAAAAYFFAGQTERAIEVAQRALQLANQSGRPELAMQIRGRLLRYQAAARTP